MQSFSVLTPMSPWDPLGTPLARVILWRVRQISCACPAGRGRRVSYPCNDCIATTRKAWIQEWDGSLKHGQSLLDVWSFKVLSCLEAPLFALRRHVTEGLLHAPLPRAVCGPLLACNCCFHYSKWLVFSRGNRHPSATASHQKTQTYTCTEFSLDRHIFTEQDKLHE